MTLDRDISNISRKIAGQFEKERRYWHERMSGELQRSGFPADREVVEKGEAEEVRFRIGGEEQAALAKISGGSPHRRHVVLLTVMTLLLEKYTGNSDIVVGMPIYRQEKEAEYINTQLPVRTEIGAGATFKEQLLKVKDAVAEAVEHQNYPMERLAEELGVPIVEGENPFYDVLLMDLDIHDEEITARVERRYTFTFSGEAGEAECRLAYDGGRNDRRTMERIGGQYVNLLGQALAQLDRPVSRLEVLTGEERQRQIYEINETETGESGEQTVHRLIEEQVRRTPEKIAVEDKVTGETVSYRELNRRADGMARRLRSEGIGLETVVAIMANRTVGVPMAILAVMKAGGAYLPVAPDFPDGRIRYMLTDSGVTHWLVQPQMLEKARGLAVGCRVPLNIISMEIGKEEDALPVENRQQQEECGGAAEAGADNSGYIIYTSGSTGKPKGVVLEHRGIVNYIRWAARQYVKDENEVMPFYTSFSFDLTVTSIFVPLITGNRVIVYGGDDREFLIREVVRDNRVSILKLTPSHMKLLPELVEEMPETRLKRLILGGENLETGLAGKIHRHFGGKIEIYNEYGPTETVVGSMIYRYDPQVDRGQSVPIGGPIDNTQIYVLDRYLKPVPPGVAGQLFISGRGVARGYLNRPELTAEKFVDNPYRPGQKMYVTGDRALINADGQIEYRGRGDGQVKLRGYRVELGEIEAKIKSYRPPKKDSIKTGADARERLREVKRCTRCLLPENYPGVQYDERGVCSECRQFDEIRPHVEAYFKQPEDLTRRIEAAKSRMNREGKEGQYDCLLLYSGGKDSTYVLYRLMDSGLKVLTFTFDNGFISDAAFDNIKRTTQQLKVDHITLTAQYMNPVFVESLRANHNACQGCWHALNTLAVKAARENGINLIISGLSRGQIYDMRLEGLFKAGIYEENEIEEKLLQFRKTFHSTENKYSRILQEGLQEEEIDTVEFVDFFRYNETPVHEIREYLAEKGWRQPADTGFCSSNCVINDVGIYVHLRDTGYHFYAAPLSWDIRLGALSREAGLAEMGVESRLEDMDDILREIGYYETAAVKDAVVMEKTGAGGDAALIAYIVTEGGASVSVDDIRGYMAKELPEYMIPSAFVQVERIPLTPAGKVDKKALRETGGTQLEQRAVYVAPRDEDEKTMARLCKEVLALDRIGINDNFFSLGATSFNIIQLNNRLRETYNRDIPVLTLFEYPTIAAFLEQMDIKNREADQARQVHEEKEVKASIDRGKNRFKKLRKKQQQFQDEDTEK